MSIFIYWDENRTRNIYICKNTILCIRKQNYITNVIIQKNIIYAQIPYDNQD